MLRKNSFILFLLTIVALVSAEVPHGFDLQAHRGGRDRRPENTLAAFSYAIELGVTTLEMDTAVTKDRVVVVSHDPRLNPKLTRDSGGKFISGTARKFIKDLTPAELKTYTVGELKPGTGYYYKHREQLSVQDRLRSRVFHMLHEEGHQKPGAKSLWETHIVLCHAFILVASFGCDGLLPLKSCVFGAKNNQVSDRMKTSPVDARIFGQSSVKHSIYLIANTSP